MRSLAITTPPTKGAYHVVLPLEQVVRLNMLQVYVMVHRLRAALARRHTPLLRSTDGSTADLRPEPPPG
jgi:hypothetical protein